MAYRELRGNIFSSDAAAIVNTVNCVGVMGKGIALEYKKRYPAMFAAYRLACRRGEIEPGSLWLWRSPDGKMVFNAAVKDDWKNPSRIEWVESCLNLLVRNCHSMGIKSLALPWLGAMNGWIPVEQIKAVTRRVLSGITDFDISVYEIRDI